MGILYRASKELMRQNFIQDLLAKGVTEKNGVSVYSLSYEELKHEAAVASFRDRNVDSDQNKWF